MFDPALSLSMWNPDREAQLDNAEQEPITGPVQYLHSATTDEFSKELIVEYVRATSTGTSSSSITNGVFTGYLDSLSSKDRNRFLNEVHCYQHLGKALSFFVRGQEMDAFGMDELSGVVRAWVDLRKKDGSAEGKKAADAEALLRNMDAFRELAGFEYWTIELMKRLRLSFPLVEVLDVNQGKRKRGFSEETSEYPGGKKAKGDLPTTLLSVPPLDLAIDLHGLYDASPKRKRRDISFGARSVAPDVEVRSTARSNCDITEDVDMT